MDFLTASKDFLCLTGKDYVHLVPLKSEGSSERTVHSIPLQKGLSVGSQEEQEVSKGKEKVTSVCSVISGDSKYVAVSDSEKQLNVYENVTDSVWNLLSSFKTEKRLLRVAFSHCSNFLVLLDKCGDVWAISLTSLRKQSKPSKILGHCSVVLDMCLNRESTRIFTCDRDEKIRLSSFPDSYRINGYFLGHKEAVVSISLLEQDNYLLSVDIEGILKLWRSDSRLCTLNVNILDLFQIDPSDETIKKDYQINSIKCTEAFGKCYFTVRILNCSRAPIFELNVAALTVRLVGELNANCSLYNTVWVENILYIASPSEAGLTQVEVTKDGVLTDSTSITFPKDNEIFADIKSFLDSNQISAIPLRKRVAYDFDDKGPRNKVKCV